MIPMKTGLKGEGVERLIERFFGDISRFPTQEDGVNWTQAQIRQIAERIDATGDCLWHAMSVVTDTETSINFGSM